MLAHKTDIMDRRIETRMTTTTSSRILEKSSATRTFENSSPVTRVGASVNESMGSTTLAGVSPHSRSTMSFDGSNDIIGMDGEKHSIVFHGNLYVGRFTMENGEPKGNGRISYESGDIYTGQFQFGKPHGYGEMMYAGGDSYDGMWNCGRPRGIGMYTCSRGRKQHIRSRPPMA